jgi:DNA-binding transcriptional LysR family regulator
MDWEDRIGRRLKLRDLHTFRAVAQRGSMAKAAADLALTQPAVSKAIADMERTLGVRLLDRMPTGVETTSYGRALLKWEVAIFDDLRQAVKEIEFLSEPSSGEVRIGAVEPMLTGFVPAIIDHLSRQYSHTVFHVSYASAPERYRELRERKLDLVIGRVLRGVAEDDLEIEILFDEPMFVVAGSGNRWLRRRRVELAQLVDEPWTLPEPNTLVGSFITEAFRAIGADVPGTGVISNSVQVHCALLATGRFLAMLPGSVMRFSAERRSLRVLPVTLSCRPTPVGIVSLKNRTISPLAQRFVDSARALATELADLPLHPAAG